MSTKDKREEHFSHRCREMARESDLTRTARALTRYEPEWLATLDTAAMLAAVAWLLRSGTVQVGPFKAYIINETRLESLRQLVGDLDVFALISRLERDEQRELYIMSCKEKK